MLGQAGSQTPIYMKCNGNELWAVLLEKAFAKFCGSYAALDGGWALWGWRVLTGDHVFRLKLQDSGNWVRMNFTAKKAKNSSEGIGGAFYETKEKFSSAQVQPSYRLTVSPSHPHTAIRPCDRCGGCFSTTSRPTASWPHRVAKTWASPIAAAHRTRAGSTASSSMKPQVSRMPRTKGLSIGVYAPHESRRSLPFA